MKRPPTGSPVKNGLSLTPRLNTIMMKTMAARNCAPRSWIDAAALHAQALEPDDHRQQERHVEGGLGQRARLAIGVAREVVTHLEHDQHHGEEDGGGVDHPGRRVVGLAPQHVAGEPERRRRDAVAAEQPVEDRRRAEGIADDARVPDDAAEHADR